MSQFQVDWSICKQGDWSKLCLGMSNLVATQHIFIVFWWLESCELHFNLNFSIWSILTRNKRDLIGFFYILLTYVYLIFIQICVEVIDAQRIICFIQRRKIYQSGISIRKPQCKSNWKEFRQWALHPTHAGKGYFTTYVYAIPYSCFVYC